MQGLKPSCSGYYAEILLVKAAGSQPKDIRAQNAERKEMVQTPSRRPLRLTTYFFFFAIVRSGRTTLRLNGLLLQESNALREKANSVYCRMLSLKHCLRCCLHQIILIKKNK